MARIEPRLLKGFRDYLPDVMLPRERLMDTARAVYRSYGFSPIDTPALEYEEILTGKGGDESDRQLYRFEDHGGRRVALRFDLTVPLARFIAQHAGELPLPFKRYQIGAVWRGENTQRGRYREFVQCDFDTVGSEEVTVDAEAVLVVHDLMRAIGFSEFTIRVNDRRLLTGLLRRLGIAEQAVPVLRALDKLQKIGAEKVAAEMVTAGGVTSAQADEVLRLVTLRGGNDEVLAQLAPLVQDTDVGRAGADSLRELLAGVRAAGAERHLALDVSIARGLDYYTGTVFETFLGSLPTIGSVCSGGRYDDLAQLYTKQRLPGVGGSLGLDRLLAAMEELGMLAERPTAAPVFLAFFDRTRRADYLRLAARLRAAGVGVEFYPDPRKLGDQLKYADRRGFRLVLVVGESEWAAGQCQVKELASGTSRTFALEDGSGQLNPELVTALA